MQAAAAQKTPPMDSFVHTAIKIPEMVINHPAMVNMRDEKWMSFFILLASYYVHCASGVSCICT